MELSKIGATSKSSSKFLDWDLPYKNHPAMGGSLHLWRPPNDYRQVHSLCAGAAASELVVAGAHGELRPGCGDDVVMMWLLGGSSNLVILVIVSLLSRVIPFISGL